MTTTAELKQQILALTREYSRRVHGSFRPATDPARTPWQEGSTIPYAGRVFGEEEVEAAVSATLDFWLTLGSEGAATPESRLTVRSEEVCPEAVLAVFQGVRVRHSVVVNPGSSDRSVAISASTSAQKPQEMRSQKPGDGAMTAADESPLGFD